MISAGSNATPTQPAAQVTQTSTQNSTQSGAQSASSGADTVELSLAAQGDLQAQRLLQQGAAANPKPGANPME
jgi:hypothetical protein